MTHTMRNHSRSLSLLLSGVLSVSLLAPLSSAQAAYDGSIRNLVDRVTVLTESVQTESANEEELAKLDEMQAELEDKADAKEDVSETETVTMVVTGGTINVRTGPGTNYDKITQVVSGKQVTVNDRSGASADIDIQVNYSLDPSAAEYLYSEYGKQQTFTQNYISNDLRSVAREQSGRFDTLTMLTNRGEYTKAVQDVLAAKWRKIGLTVEQVSVQDVRYGEAITKKYTEAQAAEIDKQKALNEQQVAKTEAETKKIKAQGEADANAVLNESLTDNVLKQHYIDALSNADQLVVVPDGADTLVQTK